MLRALEIMAASTSPRLLTFTAMDIPINELT